MTAGILFLLFAGFIALGAVMLIVSGRRELDRVRRIRETPTTPARDVRDGFVEVKGTVEPGQVMHSPFFQVPCVLVQWRVEEYRKNGKSHNWRTVLEGLDGQPFSIRDATGAVRVTPVAASRGTALAPLAAERQGALTLYLAGKNTTTSGVFRAAPDHIEGFLARHGRSASGWLLNKNMRYTEELIQPGEAIYALGHARATPGGAQLDTHGGELILANLVEEELVHRVGSSGRWRVGGGAVLGLGAATLAVFALLQ